MKLACANQSAGLTTSTELLPTLNQLRLACVLRSEDAGVGNPLAERVADGDAQLLRRVQGVDVVPARGLGDIAMQVLVAEVAVHLRVGALENGPESLYPVRVRHASHILSEAVLYALVWSVQAVLGRCHVVEDNWSRFRPRMHGVCQRARIGATYRLGRHLVRLTVSEPYHSLVPAVVGRWIWSFGFGASLRHTLLDNRLCLRRQEIDVDDRLISQTAQQCSQVHHSLTDSVFS